MAGFQSPITINEAMQRIKTMNIYFQHFKESMFGSLGR